MRNKYYPKTVFRKVVVPVVHSAEMSAALDAARAVAGDGQVILVGMVCMPEDQSLSAAAVKVREVRQFLKNFTDQPGVHIEEQVHVTHHPWDELVNWVRQVNPDLLLLDWPRSFDELNITPEALDHPPCDVAIQGGVRKTSWSPSAAVHMPSWPCGSRLPLPAAEKPGSPPCIFRPLTIPAGRISPTAT
jgi:hypothetical protein